MAGFCSEKKIHRRRCRDLNTMTNEEGKALFMAQPAGTYRIWAAKDGLRGEGTATVTAGETCEVTVTVR